MQNRTRRVVAGTAIFLFVAVAAAQTDWPTYGHDPGGQQYSPLKQIYTKNVTRLKVAWTYDTRPVNETGGPELQTASGRSGSTPRSSEPNASLGENAMSGGRGSGDANSRAPERGAPGGRSQPRARLSQASPLVAGGVMYLGTPYGRVVALEPETGKLIWEWRGEFNPSGRGIAYWPGDRTLPPQIIF